MNVPTPTVTITSPSANANLPSGSVSVTYALSPWDWYWVDLLVDGSPSASASPGDPLTIDTTWFEPGPHTLVVRASDEYGRAYDSPPVSGDVRRRPDALIWAYGAVVGVGSLSTVSW